MATGFDLSDILAIANIHPFYSNTKYPPTSEDMPDLLAKQRITCVDLKLSSFPLTWKDALWDLPFSFAFDPHL